MSRETSISGVLESVMSLPRLRNPFEFFFGLTTRSMSQSSMRMSAPGSAYAPAPQAYPQESGLFDKRENRKMGSKPSRARRDESARRPTSRGLAGGVTGPSSSSDAAGAAPGAPSVADEVEADPSSAEDSAKEQQLASFLEIMKRSGGSTGALPVDIQVGFEDMRVTSYTLLLSSPGKTPAVSVRYVSMRWGGAIGGVFFFLLPVCLIVLMLAPGSSRATRVLPLAGLAVSGLVVAALAQWGLDVVGWFLGGIPAGVIAAPFLKLNRSLSDATQE